MIRHNPSSFADFGANLLIFCHTAKDFAHKYPQEFYHRPKRHKVVVIQFNAKTSRHKIVYCRFYLLPSGQQIRSSIFYPLSVSDKIRQHFCIPSALREPSAPHFCPPSALRKPSVPHLSLRPDRRTRKNRIRRIILMRFYEYLIGNGLFRV